MVQEFIRGVRVESINVSPDQIHAFESHCKNPGKEWVELQATEGAG